MIRIKDPLEVELFDRFTELLEPSAYRRMKAGWQGCFREGILYLLSSTVAKFTDRRSRLTGPETKELFSMAGLMAVKEFFKWTNEDAVDHCNTDLLLQYALNIDQGEEISRATFFRYQKLFCVENTAREAMRLITDELLKKAQIDLSAQRLDSTPVLGNMAVFSRRRLMHHTIYAFLTQLKRHHEAQYRNLSADFRARYTEDDGWCFAENSSMLTLHYGNTKATTEEQLGYDMRMLIERFHAEASDMDSLKTMVDLSVASDTKPDTLLTDAGYGSNANVCYSETNETKQIAPTTGKKKDQVGLEECTLDELNRIATCPAGKRPMKSRFNHEEQAGYALFFKDVCEKCPLKPHCLAQKYGKYNYKWEYDAVKLRLRDRRLYELTPEFHDEYRPRNGIEALNGNLKQNTPL